MSPMTAAPLAVTATAAAVRPATMLSVPAAVRPAVGMRLGVLLGRAMLAAAAAPALAVRLISAGEGLSAMTAAVAAAMRLEPRLGGSAEGSLAPGAHLMPMGLGRPGEGLAATRRG